MEEQEDDTVFPEYDPTPYGGGYDAEEVYGISNAPSDKSCYGRENGDNNSQDFRDEDFDDNGSVVSAYGVELPDSLHQQVQPQPGQIQNPTPKPKPKPVTQDPDPNVNVNPPVSQEIGKLRETPHYDFDSYCRSGFVDIFNFEDATQPGGDRFHEPQPAYLPSDDISEKVASWLFSTKCI